MTNTSDVLIVGAGVIGLSIARELRKRNAGSICVLEKGQSGREASWAAAGILAPQVEAVCDGEFFRLCLESKRMYSQFAQQLLDETSIDIEHSRNGVICVGFDGADQDEFERIYKWQARAGLKVERLSHNEVIRIEPHLNKDATCGLLFPDNGQVENRKLNEALIAFADFNNIAISSGVEVKEVLSDEGKISLFTSSGTYSSDKVVLATGAWTSFIKLGEATVPIEVKPMKGQMISFESFREVSRVIYSKRGYVVPRRDGRLLVGATVEDVGFDKTTTDAAESMLRDVGSEIIPSLRGLQISERWSGLRPYVSRGEPFIGAVPGHKNLFAAVGHFRNGILLAPITARMIADLVCK